jgi:formylglycine-generating enzyme required for sulfatase activity
MPPSAAANQPHLPTGWANAELSICRRVLTRHYVNKRPGSFRAGGKVTLYTCLNMGSFRLLLLTLTLVASTALQAAETRIALVMGNSDYSSGRLPNPANDAKLVGDALTSLGFDVIARRNADQVTMKRAIQEFGSRLEKAGPSAVGLFYYAGHGLQLSGRNYLIPTTAHIEREGDVEIEAVSADWVIEQMRYARNRLNIVILDACRNNPFTRSMRSVDHGLASMDAPAGILIAYSTAPGAVAADGNGRNSPYTEALTQAIREMHEPVEQVFKHVRVGVMSATAGKQVPWESSSLTGDFYFAAPNKVAPETANALASGAVPATQTANTGTAKPETGTFGTWVSGLFGSSKESPPKPPVDSRPPAIASNAPVAAANHPAAVGALLPGVRTVPLLQSLGIPANEIDGAHNYPEPAIRQLIEGTPRRVTLGSTPEQIRAAFALCRQYSSACQLSWYGDEGLRNVTLDPFEMDPTPVSVRAFRQFVDATHYKTQAETAGFAYAVVEGTLQPVTGGSWRNAVKKHAVEDDSPVVGVSFQDAVAYCRFKGARLPSEDEWEYVARGPKRHVFPWGDSIEPAAIAPNAPPAVSDGPAEGIGGRYKGLSGNVWQWVDTKVGGRKVLKGGSWLEPNPANKRAASRRYELSNRADEDSGFRCARASRAWPDSELWLAQLK